MLKIIPVINLIIKNKRKEIKVIQEEFAKIINKSATTVKRYDTGDIIPENTLILICEKLEIWCMDLASLQEKENKKENTSFYNDFIKKNKLKVETKVNINFPNHLGDKYVPILENKKNELEISFKLTKIYSFFYDDKIIIETSTDRNLFYVTNTVYNHITGTEKNKILDVLTYEQADKLVNDVKEYLEFKIEKIRKLNNFTVAHELGHEILKENDKK